MCEFELKDPFMYSLICYNGEIPVGFALFREIENDFMLLHKFPKLIYLIDIYTITEYQNSGIGSRMINFIKNWGITRGCEKIILSTSFYNKKAHKFYEKNDFIEERLCLELYLN